MVAVQEQQTQPVLLHGRLVARGRRPVLELWVHHSSIGVVRSTEGWRHASHEAAWLSSVGVVRCQTQHNPARCVAGGQVPRHARHGDQYDANTDHEECDGDVL